MDKSVKNIYKPGSKSSFENLYRDFWKRLYIICFQKTNDAEASEEMVQDIFVSLWKKGKDLKIDSSIEVYLVGAAKYKVLDYYRSQIKLKECHLGDCNLCDQAGFDEIVLEHNEALEGFLKEDLEVIVDRLPCQCQKVYRLSRENNLTTKEIATLLDISPKTVKNHITKALSYIRPHLKGSL
ncbi:sigma-70 family RNA polymerase sigma factor [Flavivirga aquimarina]|uniref:Sigma-70 family RNA polymerase sigma factor n=1 Tax=Flavivirga aquimarina TaxID=2027862 RepID=A0ABT8W542_9FLAO|nr:sigma-70 family RNA polymerase sigma factor [Flavivirga aquimarina]MDO5968236.1 sigma-70 family RNA polymerase sigma factor [Flavivirga aquimarina]